MLQLIKLDDTMNRLSSRAVELRQRITQRIQRKAEKAMVAIITYLLSNRDVQRAIAKTFEGDTPLCRVLDKAVEVHFENNEVDADNVHGLERYIEDAVEAAFRDFNVEADSVQGLEDAIREYLEAGDVVEEVIMQIAKKLGR